MVEMVLPDGTYVSSIVANLNTFSSNPATSKGEGEIIYNITANKVYVNIGTAGTPNWNDISGGWISPATSDLDMADYNITNADTVQAKSTNSLTFKVSTGKSFIFQKV